MLNLKRPHFFFKLKAMQPEFKEYQLQVMANANTMATELMARGYDIVSGKRK